jgi:hypothetical protein
LAEIIEYLLGFAISASIAAFSIVALNNASPVINSVSTNSEYKQIVSAVKLALKENNDRTIVLYLDDASINCSNGNLSFSTRGVNYSLRIDADCAFNFSDLSGLIALEFIPSPFILDLKVHG